MKSAAPGRIVQGLHVTDEGSGRFTVVLEAGIAATSLSWSLVQQPLAKFARVISYDRAGFGWSADPAPDDDGTARAAARSLERLLDAIEVRGPIILGGHSFGALIARVFQQEAPGRVAGMVLLDPVVREEWQPGNPRLARAAKLSRRGALLARAGVVGAALRLLAAGSHRLPQAVAKASAGKAAGVAERLAREVGKMPRQHWPAIARHWSRARPFETMARNLEKLPVSVLQFNGESSLGDLPVTILSAKPTPEHQRDALLSSRGENIVVEDTGHWIQLDRPDAVIEAIRKLCV